ncbi:hypothetical protein RAA17_12950 [Komagataeibacter rhaeticus]|nr:hypothetical protein [Komagataeibacter rhaeticus]
MVTQGCDGIYGNDGNISFPYVIPYGLSGNAGAARHHMRVFKNSLTNNDKIFRIPPFPKKFHQKLPYDLQVVSWAGF